MRARIVVPLIGLAMLVSAMPAVAQSNRAGLPRPDAVDRRASVPTITFHLTVLGDVPTHAQFGLYVQTDPPTADVQTHYFFCPNGNLPLAFCGRGPDPDPYVLGSGVTMTYAVSWPLAEISDHPVTIVYRYDRVVRGDGRTWPGQWRPFYEARLTVPRGQRGATIYMTYDYNLRVPDTAMGTA